MCVMSCACREFLRIFAIFCDFLRIFANFCDFLRFAFRVLRIFWQNTTPDHPTFSKFFFLSCPLCIAGKGGGAATLILLCAQNKIRTSYFLPFFIASKLQALQPKRTSKGHPPNPPLHCLQFISVVNEVGSICPVGGIFCTPLL